MSPENVVNPDIEKNKELFEYEMTEVLMNLKGEFAAFSGKGTRFAESMVSEEQLEFPEVSFSEIALTDVHINVSAERPKAGYTSPCIAEAAPVKAQLPEKPPTAPPFSVAVKAVSVPLPKYALPAGGRGGSIPDHPVSKNTGIAVPAIPPVKAASIPKPAATSASVQLPPARTSAWKPFIPPEKNNSNTPLPLPEVAKATPVKVRLAPPIPWCDAAVHYKVKLPEKPPVAAPISVAVKAVSVPMPEYTLPVSGGGDCIPALSVSGSTEISVPHISQLKEVSIPKQAAVPVSVLFPSLSVSQWHPFALPKKDISVFVPPLPKTDFRQSIPVAEMRPRKADVELPAAAGPSPVIIPACEPERMSIPVIPDMTLPQPPRIV